MAESETSQLLPNYNTEQRANMKSSEGRGKSRFEMRSVAKLKCRLERRRMKNKHGSESRPASIFGSVIRGVGGANAKSSPMPREFPKEPNHSFLYTILNPKSSAPSASLFQHIMAAIIVLDLVIYVVSTEPDLSHLSFFYYAEAFSSSVFAVEYFARLIVCTEKRSYRKHGPFRGRLKYVCSGHALLDALATFPFFIELLSGISLPTMTYLRIFRVLRITRTKSSCKAMEAVYRVLYFNREILHVAALLAIYLIIVTSVLMYYLRPRGEDVEKIDDPTDFASIPNTMVLSVLMLTGQGGPEGQLPWYTQCVVLLTGLFSIAMFAIPASMLTWGFEAEAERLATRAKKRAMKKRIGEEVSCTSSSSSSSDDNSGLGDISTSDEEYMNIIGGGGDDSEKEIKSSSSFGRDEVQPLLIRVENLEQRLAQTNSKLDLILQKLE